MPSTAKVLEKFNQLTEREKYIVYSYYANTKKTTRHQGATTAHALTKSSQSIHQKA